MMAAPGPGIDAQHITSPWAFERIPRCSVTRQDGALPLGSLISSSSHPLHKRAPGRFLSLIAWPICAARYCTHLAVAIVSFTNAFAALPLGVCVEPCPAHRARPLWSEPIRVWHPWKLVLCSLFLFSACHDWHQSCTAEITGVRSNYHFRSFPCKPSI